MAQPSFGSFPEKRLTTPLAFSSSSLFFFSAVTFAVRSPAQKHLCLSYNFTAHRFLRSCLHAATHTEPPTCALVCVQRPMGPPTSGPKQKVHSEYAVRCLLVCEVLPPVDVDEHFVAVDEDHPHLPGHGSDFGPKGDALGMAVLERNHEAVFLARKRSVRSDRLRLSDQGGRLLLSDQSPCTCICTGIHTLYIYMYMYVCYF